MEDSEQRRKRLKEMRMQADQAEVSGGVEGSLMPGFLSNPLIEAPSAMPSQDKSYAAPRFDFYTDPMSAFSSDKRNNAGIQAAPDNFPPKFGGSPVAQYSSRHPESTNPQMTPHPVQVSPAAYRNPVWNGPSGPAHYNLPLHPLSAGTYPSPTFEPSGGPLYNSAQIDHRPSYSPNPYPGYGNNPRPSYSPNPSPGYGNNPRPSYGPNPSPGYGNNPRPSYGPNPSPGYGNNPRPSYGPNPSPGYGNNPRPSYGPNPSPGYGNNPRPSYSPNPSTGYRNSPRPSYSSNPSPGYRNTPSPGQGRGRGFWHNTGTPVSGRGSGQGQNFHGPQSNENTARGPDRFYKRSMVEDPWKHLEPIIWKAIDGSLNTSRIPENSQPWTSKSTSTKKEVPSAASVKSSSEPSLAEYLAAAFNEAANDVENV